LRWLDVLILVNENSCEGALPSGSDLLAFLEEADTSKDEVIKVQAVVLVKHLLVEAINDCHGAFSAARQVASFPDVIDGWLRPELPIDLVLEVAGSNHAFELQIRDGLLCFRRLDPYTVRHCVLGPFSKQAPLRMGG